MFFNFFLRNTLAYSSIDLKFTDKQHHVHFFNTPFKIRNSDWDQSKERPKNIYAKTHKKLNAKLDRIKIAIAEYAREKEREKEKISKIAIEKIINKFASPSEIYYPEGTLLYYMQSYISSRVHLISQTTYKRYMVFFRLLERFEGNITKHIQLEEVNSSFVKNFLRFGEIEEYSKSTIYRTVDFVRTILNYVEKRGIRTFSYELEIPKKRNINQLLTLTEDELITIKRTPIPIHLKAAKDWLIISCYVGQRVSDFMNFQMEMMAVIDGIPCMSFKQQKTQKDILLPLHPIALEVMSENNQAFPLRLSNQKYNEQIKQVVQLAGIKNLVKVHKRNGHRGQDMVLQKWQAITSHIGRRSFASNFYGKIPTPLLMEATGHSTEQMFNRYVSLANTERTVALGTHLYKAYSDKYLNQQEFATKIVE
ncbi:site-specific integrase [Sphingobacterium faecium]|uniref:tyrosine-type recombinase/integrase n=1 Tax=Sphingobacterium faecium TaxID=34087 RepID=UPI001292B000|nr:tyrosine-type recombinase/integrase [Sphingobacterium faecium]MQP26327.1 tyrosine-type recombinase/integrase [Sphingobacterium faecium]UXD67943.1 site-specific integrase [Sphingobacterium faecium]